MSALRAAALAASFVGIGAAAARAQAALGPVRTLTIGAGVAVNARVDDAVSPLHFTGSGFSAAAQYEHTRGKMVVAASLSAVSHDMRARQSATPALEQYRRADIGFMLTRATGANAQRGFAFGADANASAALTEHRYTDPLTSSANFTLVTVAVGPAATWTESVAGGRLRVEAGAPVAALVSHSYGDEKAQRSAARLRAVDVRTFRGARGALTFEPAPSRRLGVSYRYELAALRFDDVQSVRSVSQTFRAALVTRF